MHLNLALTIVAIPILALFALFTLVRGRVIIALFAAVAMCVAIGSAAQGHGTCVSTVQSAATACGN